MFRRYEITGSRSELQSLEELLNAAMVEHRSQANAPAKEVIDYEKARNGSTEVTLPEPELYTFNIAYKHIHREGNPQDISKLIATLSGKPLVAELVIRASEPKFVAIEEQLHGLGYRFKPAQVVKEASWSYVTGNANLDAHKKAAVAAEKLMVAFEQCGVNADYAIFEYSMRDFRLGVTVNGPVENVLRVRNLFGGLAGAPFSAVPQREELSFITGESR